MKVIVATNKWWKTNYVYENLEDYNSTKKNCY